MDKSIITTAKIRQERFIKVVNVHYVNGNTEDIITYFPDEISFTPGEFTGLTRDQAMELYRKRDIAYLQS